MSDDLTILGHTVRKAVDKLECFTAPAGIGMVTFVSEELASMCPATGQPDLSAITITYQPDQLCIESKSLKLYLWSWRDRGAFVEQMATEIAERVAADAMPKWVDVSIRQSVRGGIVTTATCEIRS